MIEPNKTLIIFDWDGTLMDSTGRIVSAMQTTAKNLSLPIPSAEQVRGIIGLSLEGCYQRLFPDFESRYSEITEEYRYQYVEGDQTPSPLFQGVRETLQQLKDQGLTLAVATGKARHGLDRVLHESNLKSFFDVTIAADEAKSKPDPEMLLRLMKQTETKPHQALMVGDTSFDLEMAKNAGMESIAVSYGAHTLEVLNQYAPLAIVDDFRQILKNGKLNR